MKVIITLKEAGELKKLKGRLEAEIELVRVALKDDLRKLQRKPREILIRLSPEEFKNWRRLPGTETWKP